MTLLTPWTAFLAAAVAVPLLLALYFLKLRRRRLGVASTLLWRRTFRDLQVNAPFQRLRFTPLLLVQLLLIVLLVLALGEPVVEGEVSTAARTILLVDQSASMNAADADAPHATRLDAAKASAREIAQGLTDRGGRGEVMIISFGAAPRLVTGFEGRRQVLLEAIDAIAPTDEEADLAAALRLAGSFAGPEEAEPPEVVLLSDGGVRAPEDGAGFALRAGRMRYIRTARERKDGAAPPANTGVVALSARRDHREPGRVLVFARLAAVPGETRDGAGEQETMVTLFVDGAPALVERARLRAVEKRAEPRAETAGRGLLEATVTFSLELPEGAVLAVGHDRRDALIADDVAALVMPPPARPRVAFVHDAALGPDAFLRRLVEESDPQRIRIMSLGAWEEAQENERELLRTYDLAVFDRVAPSRLPPLPTLTVGAAPPGIATLAPARPGGRRAVGWRREHPIMRHVALDTIAWEGFGAFELPDDAVELARGPDGPVIALFNERAAPHVAVGFELARSNWPGHVSIAVFMQNAMEVLTIARSGRDGIVARPGDTVAVRAEPGASTLVLEGPGGAPGAAAGPSDAAAARDRGAAEDAAVMPAPRWTREIPVPEDRGVEITLPPLRRAGLHRVRGAASPHDRVAMAVLSEVETDIRGRERLIVNAEAVDAGARDAAAPRSIWPWFIAAALAVLALEWLLYCHLART